MPTAPADVTIESIAVGGEGVAHLPDGRVVFVAGTVPGDVVAVDVESEHDRWARGHVAALRHPGPDRVDPPCPAVAAGCGGCDWQHVRPDRQLGLKTAVVRDVLARQAGLGGVAVTGRTAGGLAGYRTTVRLAVADGRTAYRRARSHDLVAPDRCAVLHPDLERLRSGLVTGDQREVMLRVGARTGEAMVLGRPTAAGIVAPSHALVVGDDDLAGGTRAWIHELVAGHRLRVSARSFFQASPEMADALVDTAAAMLHGVLTPSSRLLDLYGGIGLFAVGLDHGGPVTVVERNRSAVADATVNLAGRRARVVRVAVQRYRVAPADVVVADPARRGLERAGVECVVRTGAPHLVLVSCDAGSLGRDAGLLSRAGFELRAAVVLDAFPMTSHVEVVTHWCRAGRPGTGA